MAPYGIIQGTACPYMVWGDRIWGVEKYVHVYHAGATGWCDAVMRAEAVTAAWLSLPSSKASSMFLPCSFF